MATSKLFKNTKREKSTTTKGHYVTNGVLLPAVIEAKALGKVTDKLIRMIQMIAERYSRKSNFIGYSFREDMVSAAVMNLCNNALKFNPEKSSNPFSFYTTAIHNSFLQYMADEKKHRNIRDALLIDAGSNPSFNFMQGEKDEDHFEVKESDEIYVPERNLEDVLDAPVQPNAIVDGVPVVVPPKEAKIRYAARIPGECKRYGPEDIIVDPVTGAITIKEKPTEVAVTTKKLTTTAPKKKVVVEEAVTAKTPRKTAAVKEKVVKAAPVKEKVVAVKKKAEKTVAVKKIATKTPTAKTPRAKKVVEEVVKPAAKKVAKKTVAEKKPAVKAVVKKPVEKKTATKKTTKTAK